MRSVLAIALFVPLSLGFAASASAEPVAVMEGETDVAAYQEAVGEASMGKTS